MKSEHSAISIKITGRVQGVWFRASTKNEADRLGITGFVKNDSDGGVYIEASGPVLNLDDFVKWCNKGPDLARVNSVEVHQISLFDMADFEVRRG